MTSSQPIRVLVADDHPIVRAGLFALLNHQTGLESVAEAGTGQEAVDCFRTHQPDVTLMDLRMPEMDGVTAITTIREEFPEARIIVLTTYDGDEDIYRGLHAGARGYLLKGVPCRELVEAIHAVHAGKKWIPSVVGVKLMERMDTPSLTEREREVLGLMAKGQSNQDISRSLQVTEGTVKFHINRILSKLGVSDRTQAVISAFRRGMASP
ncbi:response regulator transcription factor [Leptolyngbya sp. FACHB-261]|uniref:response regulator n=1 Tax=Leptolyngbya sp. FACHB-261 TaxID=2692806 RepID=UPI001681C918|nr:response regulator transcription factor [Leptolyngbya sp. FACHB-261]MBD2102654.1 response regulator transcription factor [Leptolyngbya sp. FACHB-261]